MNDKLIASLSGTTLVGAGILMSIGKFADVHFTDIELMTMAGAIGAVLSWGKNIVEEFMERPSSE